ncbi:MAG: urea transporter [Bacteroidales bacterium]|nr:urea transporter [Bacteroidales bacterium]
MRQKELIISFIKGLVHAYGQIFFTNQRFFSILLIIVSFFDLYAGLCGVLAVVSAHIVAYTFGFNRTHIQTGMYGFNALLVGLGLGIYFDMSLALVFIVVVSAILTLFIAVMLEGVLYKYGLPFLSIPFLLVVWVLNLAASEFTALGVSERGLYTLNELYASGGSNLVQFYQWWNNLVNNNWLTTYFISLGAIFFQYNVLAGILIAFGLLIYSRIAFSLSLLGYLAAFLFYKMIGSDISAVSYMYIGFNYILTAIALGGFFIIPKKTSYFWVVLLTPLVAILTISLNKIFYNFGISIYSLPFNIIVLLFLYVLKLRYKPATNLLPTVTQEFVPEKNLYSHLNYKNKFNLFDLNIPVQLPFFGRWTVSQGHEGEFTHQGEWRHAWDFVINDSQSKQFKNQGDFAEDYYCYGKSVLACADGYIEEILDGIDDNAIGEVNLDQNWGNTVVIRHHQQLFSKVSHLKKGSIKVSKGEYVKAGQIIAEVGNSGRSPFPHMHFQLQATPFIGSKTISYPIVSFLLYSGEGTQLKQYDYPKVNDVLEKPLSEKLLLNAFKWAPGRVLRFEDEHRKYAWEVKINYLNQTYLEDQDTGDKAYFQYNNDILIFTNYLGSQKNKLFYFYLACQKVSMYFFEGLTLKSTIRPNEMYGKWMMFFQDFIAPFYIWLKPQYSIVYQSERASFLLNKMDLRVFIKHRKSNRSQEHFIEINELGISDLHFNIGDKSYHLKAQTNHL